MLTKKSDPRAGRRAVLAWCLYDAGNSAFATVIITFVFSVYFARSIVGDETHGSTLWSYALAVSGLLVALASPVLGALADHYGPRKPGLVFFSLVCIVPAALLYFGAPHAPEAQILLLLGCLVLANAGFEIALVYANAMLPDIAPPSMMGRISGWAWAAGYAGGLVCLALTLVLLVGIGDMKPLLPLPRDQSQNVRAAAPLTALWFALLSLPLLLWAPDRARQGVTLRQAAGQGLKQLGATLRGIRGEGNIFRFLLGSAIYRDGLNTLFAMGGLYAADVFSMDFTDILVFAIGLNVTSGIGAFLFAYLDDAIGSRRTALIALAGLCVCGAIILPLHDKNAFIGMALLLGLFIGPAQSASRTLAARLAPPGKLTQTYGLYALTGKAVSFGGPLAYGLATHFFGLQQAGMATIILFWLAGMALLATVKEERAA